MNEDQDELKYKLLASPYLFTKFFYPLRTGREFNISQPVGRKSHHEILFEAFRQVMNGEILRLNINIPPGHGKSEMVCHMIAWGMARYPDSNYLYISFGHELASSHTHTIKQIMDLPEYRKIFGIEIRKDSKAKDFFTTTAGGVVAAFGSSGPITGRNAGLPYVERWSGGVFMDDMHKPDEVMSDTMRARVKNNYLQTIYPRPRSPHVPMILIGQRLHEDDLTANLMQGYDGAEWHSIVLRAVDDAENILDPSIITKEKLMQMKETNPYVYYSQYQQQPTPAGGGLFKETWWRLLDEEPKVEVTFITADTAETDKDYNDATVFSFWGLYRIMNKNVDTGMWGLHWLGCEQMRVEPVHLEAEFFQFYSGCMTHPVKPSVVAIEKKSTGVTLLSVLQKMQGIKILPIDRTKLSKSKADRFLSIQQYVGAGQISFTRFAKHTAMCIDHCSKITGNNAHAHDDIADTLYDAVKIGLIDKTLTHRLSNKAQSDATAKMIMSQFQRINNLNTHSHGRPSHGF